MNKHLPTSPFKREELIPQEEKLEVVQQRSKLLIGIPKENAHQEKRVCLTPDAINALVAHGHKILMEAGAGEGANFSDKEYIVAGVTVTKDTKKVFSCPLILKIEPPTLEEINYIQPNTTIISALQIKTQPRTYIEKLASKRISALAFEYIRDEDGNYPAVRSISEIAGISSVLIAAELISNSDFGSGVVFGNISGVPPVEVVILGAGTVGEYAAKSSLGLGANVRIFDNSITKLRTVQTNLGHPVYTSTIQPKNLLKSLKRCDIAIGALRGNNRAPIVVTQTMVEHMKKSAVIIDVSIDRGGCFETSEVTSHKKPTFKKYGITHYCVPNIPSRYPRTSSVSISNIITPYLINIGENGGMENAFKFDKGLRNGLYLYHGILTKKSVGDWFDLPSNDINFLIY